MKVYAPGKLILSGEHAVVYGRPALAMAINRYAKATITKEVLPQILFDLSDLAHRSQLSLQNLSNLKKRIKRKYHKFINGDYRIRDVLHKPFELAQFALSVFAETFSIADGVKIKVQSDVPIGCGMGSSAATIVSVMSALSHYLNLQLSEEDLFKLALQAENMQHGYSSGIDLRVSLYGGCLFVKGNQIERRNVPKFPMFLVNTGTPLSTTGQCVEEVAIHFKDNKVADEIESITLAMNEALQSQHQNNMQIAIQANHRALVTLGVVPNKVQEFIKTLERLGGYAKVCGAGAVLGDQAGAVLIMIDDNHSLQNTCSQFGYVASEVIADERGVHVL